MSVPKAAVSTSRKEVGRKGGLTTAQTHSKEWLQNRARKGGTMVRDMYGTDYYRHINSKRRARRGWPKGKSRTLANRVRESIKNMDLPSGNKRMLLAMLDVISGR